MRWQPAKINFEVERLFQLYIELMDKKDEEGCPNFVTFFEDRLKPDPVFVVELNDSFRPEEKAGPHPRLALHTHRAAKLLGALKRSFARFDKTGRGYETYLLCLVEFKMEHDAAFQYLWEAPCQSHEDRYAVIVKACEIARRYLPAGDAGFFDFLPEK